MSFRLHQKLRSPRSKGSMNSGFFARLRRTQNDREKPCINEEQTEKAASEMLLRQPHQCLLLVVSDPRFNGPEHSSFRAVRAAFQPGGLPAPYVFWRVARFEPGDVPHACRHAPHDGKPVSRPVPHGLPPFSPRALREYQLSFRRPAQGGEPAHCQPPTKHRQKRHSWPVRPKHP